MEILGNISEYYDELFPVSKEQKKFFEEEVKKISIPLRLLSVNCGSGLFEHNLAENGVNVTAIEDIAPLLESANRRRRNQLMMLNIFQMNTLEMARFLGKGFFNIISILNDRLIFISDEILLQKFFFDCKQLLSENGKLIISIPNFEKYNSNEFELPVRESIRVKLFSKVKTNFSNEKILEQKIETGNGKLKTVTSNAKISVLTREKILEITKKIGFSEVKFYSDFNKTDFDVKSEKLFCVLKV